MPGPDREDCPKRERHLPEDVPRETLADGPLDPFHRLDRLDATLDQREERLILALVHRVGRLPTFAALDPAARDRLSRAAADISQAAGEWSRLV
jgi:hypothetical protein